MSGLSAYEIAAAMGGKVSPSNPNIARVPGPGHSRHDDSLAVIISDSDPEGFYTHSHSHDDWKDCRDHVRSKLGLQRPDYKKPAMFIAPKPKGERTGSKIVTARYVYLNEKGDEHHRVTRMEWEGGAKTFSQEHYEIDTWKSGEGELPSIPYNLPAIIERHDEPIWLVEGEKNAEDLIARGLVATTAKGGSSAFPNTKDFSQWFDGSTVYALPDNDEPGQKWLAKVVEAIPHAQAVHIPGLPPKGDVSDWLAAGGTPQELFALAAAPKPEPAPKAVIIAPTPFEWCDPASIPPREWVYDTHLIRKFVSLTVSPGGLGKSSLALVEALSMVVNRPLLDDARIHEPDLRVWYWNGEDPQEETRRRVMAACKHYGISSADLGGRLFTDSGRDMPLLLGHIDREGIQLDDTLFQKIEQTMIENRIDVFMADPFVSAHRLGENDNNAIDALIKRLGKLADVTNAAVEIVHHVRKPNSTQAETDVNDARGASALIGGVRSARVLNVMSEDIASAASVNSDLRQRHFSVSDGKANMSPKAGEARWRFLESVCLDNQTPDRKADNVGVVTFFKMPEEAKNMVDLSGSEDAMRIILSQDDTVRHWTGRGPKPKNWIGHRIMEALNIHDQSKDAAIHKLVLGWISDGVIFKRSMLDKNNRVTVLALKGDSFAASASAPDDDDTPF